jgi:RNA polymerase sigma-70 factor, ECF subfamily
VLTPEVLAACIESRRARLTRMATSMLDDPAEAEDVVQDAAESAIRSSSNFRHAADVCTWFQRICLNACYESLRRRKSATALEQALRLEQLWRDPTYTVDPERVVVGLEDSEKLRRALASLSPDQRAAVVLHDLNGFKAREIADGTGAAVPTVKSHLRRGRQALVSLLAEVDT